MLALVAKAANHGIYRRGGSIATRSSNQNKSSTELSSLSQGRGSVKTLSKNHFIDPGDANRGSCRFQPGKDPEAKGGRKTTKVSHPAAQN